MCAVMGLYLGLLIDFFAGIDFDSLEDPLFVDLLRFSSTFKLPSTA